MNKNLTEIVFILDRSGSMEGLEKDTIGGFNSLIKKQKAEDGEAFISTVLFDDEIDVIHDRVPLKKIERLTDEEYYVRGCTALFDAVGSAIKHIGNIHKYAREEDRPSRTLFVITTDGMENASVKYDKKTVKRLIEGQKKKYGWEFIFLGANIDAADEAAKIGINKERAVNYCNDAEGTALNFSVLSKAISGIRSAKLASPKLASMHIDACLEEINEDYQKRGKKR